MLARMLGPGGTGIGGEGDRRNKDMRRGPNVLLGQVQREQNGVRIMELLRRYAAVV